MRYKDAVVLTDDHDCCFFPLIWERCHSWSCRSDLLERHPEPLVRREAALGMGGTGTGCAGIGEKRLRDALNLHRNSLYT